MSEEYILRLDCPDQPGIVAAVAALLQNQSCNIEDATQFSDKTSNRFFMRTVFRPLTPEPKTIQDLETNLQELAQKFEMKWHVHPCDDQIKTIIMASKADHCLNDLLYRWRTNQLPINITAVISNHEEARPLVEERGLKFIHMPITPDTKQTQEEALSQLIKETGTELIVLARYMQVLSNNFCEQYPGRIINIHHSFLPGFKGAKPYHQAYERGVKIIGATAHFVTADLDEGPIIEQETARVDHTDNPRKMQILGRDTESRVLARAVQFYTERRIFLHGNRTVIL